MPFIEENGEVRWKCPDKIVIGPRGDLSPKEAVKHMTEALSDEDLSPEERRRRAEQAFRNTDFSKVPDSDELRRIICSNPIRPTAEAADFFNIQEDMMDQIYEVRELDAAAIGSLEGQVIAALSLVKSIAAILDRFEVELHLKDLSDDTESDPCTLASSLKAIEEYQNSCFDSADRLLEFFLGPEPVKSDEGGSDTDIPKTEVEVSHCLDEIRKESAELRDCLDPLFEFFQVDSSLEATEVPEGRTWGIDRALFCYKGLIECLEDLGEKLFVISPLEVSAGATGSTGSYNP